MAKDSSLRGATTFGSGAVGAASSSAEAAAADVFRAAKALLLRRPGGTASPTVQQKGHLLEYIEAAQFNERAVLARSDLQAGVTIAERRPQALADIEMVEGGQVVKEIQAKSSERAERIAFRSRPRASADHS